MCHPFNSLSKASHSLNLSRRYWRYHRHHPLGEEIIDQNTQAAAHVPRVATSD
jgi:hypothetical protein